MKPFVTPARGASATQGDKRDAAPLSFNNPTAGSLSYQGEEMFGTRGDGVRWKRFSGGNRIVFRRGRNNG